MPGDNLSKSNFERCRDFHLRLDGRVPGRPTVPGPEVLALRATLLREEAAEVQDALAALAESRGPSGLAAVAHELADLLYVAYGTFVALGIDADAVFAEVHAANLRKLSGPRRADGKQLKPDGWRPADVAGVLERLAADPAQNA